MPDESTKLSLTLPSDLCMLGVVRTFVEAICETHGFDRATVHAIVLATAEAVSNIVRHAHHNRADAQIQIRCSFAERRFEIELWDEGEPFDVCCVPHLDPAELRVGGRGVFLMRTLMDAVTCVPRGARGNILRMVKHVGDPPARNGD